MTVPPPLNLEDTAETSRKHPDIEGGAITVPDSLSVLAGQSSAETSLIPHQEVEVSLDEPVQGLVAACIIHRGAHAHFNLS